jgi:hypothetical protein
MLAGNKLTKPGVVIRWVGKGVKNYGGNVDLAVVEVIRFLS